MKTIVLISVCLLMHGSFELSPILGPHFMATQAQQTLQIAIEGMVTVDGKPHAAVIEINSTLKNHGSLEKTNANEKTGLFKTQLRKGDEYELLVKVNKFPPQVLLVSTKNLDSDKSINVFADFTSPAYDHKLEELKKAIDEKYNKSLKLAGFEEKYGKLVKENLYYKIQVGAFKFYENFNYTPMISLPKIIRKIDSDYITRFTIGNYSSYNEALVVLRKVQACDLKEAFIVAYYNGERKLLGQLLSEKILD